MTIACVLADFDGTACPDNVADELCRRYASSGWEAYDEAVARDELTLRAAIDSQAPMLNATCGEMLRFALRSFRVAVPFVTLMRWARVEGLGVAVVSDGFGFYIQSMLAAVGLPDVPVLTNLMIEGDGGRRLAHPHAHPECAGCGTCKMQAILDYRRSYGPVAFIGDGLSDRYAALYADVTFAKDRLATLCDRDGIGYVPWATLDDVRQVLASGDYPASDHDIPDVCPGRRRAAPPVARETAARELS